MAKYPQYLSSNDMFYPSILSTINKKRGSPLQPIFEALTNSLEALDDKSKGNLEICIHLRKDLLPEDSDLANFSKITIKDNGIGLNDAQFDRLKMLRDSRKGPSNRGTGRIQFIHYFDETNITSIFKTDSSSTGSKKRIVTLSKAQYFLHEKNSIIRIDSESEVESKKAETTVTFTNPLDNSDGSYYAKLNAKILKDELVRHYLALFCKIKDNFPKIIIRLIIDNKVKSSETILTSEIPSPDKSHPIMINYSRIENNKIVVSSKKEVFELKAFRIESEKLEKNEIKLISKDEIARGLNFDGLLPKEDIKGDRFLFLLSGKYIDEKDTDTRGQIKLLDHKDFLMQFQEHLTSDDDNSHSWIGQDEEEILLPDIENKTNSMILHLYPEIDALRKEKNNKIDELKEMFLLNQKAISDSKITINDSYEDILTKVYREEARLMAQKDAKFGEHFRKIKKLKPNKTDYQESLNLAVAEFVKDVPFKDKILLAKYVARRRLVLEIFDDLLNNDERKKELGGRIDESILHNLIFQQTSSNPEDSDLWLINEEFIYFRGTSEFHLSDLKYDGKNIMKDESLLTQEQIRYLNSLNERRLEKKPDVLLFPNEGKCIIIEFKAPDVNVSRYIGQIDSYAALLRNFSIDEFHIETFYGYLIGESIEDIDVRGINHRMEHSDHFEYWFRPAEAVPAFYGRTEGSIYLEVIKYSTLLERAKTRNKMFMKKLGIDIGYDKSI